MMLPPLISNMEDAFCKVSFLKMLLDLGYFEKSPLTKWFYTQNIDEPLGWKYHVDPRQYCL